MINAKMCLVAEGITIDRDSNQISVYSLIEELQAETYPLFAQKLAFFCLWERASADPARCRAEFSITLDGEDLVRQAIDVDFGVFLRNRCTSRLEGFSLPRPGTIVFRLAIPGHGTAEWIIAASFAAPGAPGAPGAGAWPAARNLWQSENVTKTFPLANYSTR